MRRLRTAATPFGWCVCVALMGCSHDNPGFKVKGSADGSGASETSVSASGVTSETSAPTTGTTTEPSTSTSVMSAGSASSEPPMTETGATQDSATTDAPLEHSCPDNEKKTVELPVLADTFLVDRSWKDFTAPCFLLQEVAPEYQWEQGLIYCRDRNFGLLPALPLMDMPSMEGRDAIHYLVKFDLTPLAGVQFAQIVGAELQLTVKRLGEGTTLGAFALHPDQVWEEGTKAGDEATENEPTYRCRKAPKGKVPVNDCIAPWTFGTPIPEEGSPIRYELTETLPEGVISPFLIDFNWSDFKDALEPFFSEAGHQGFFIGLPAFPAVSTADRLKVYAREAAEDDPVLRVTYCPQ